MFSVVLSCYNHEQYVAQAVRSALQSALVGEVLVVDDGSSDRSPDILRDLAKLHERVRLVDEDGENLGAPTRYNQLIDEAQQPWIAMLDSDDYHLPGRYESVRKRVQESSSEFAFGQIRMIDHFGERAYVYDGIPRSAGDKEIAFLKRTGLASPGRIWASLQCCNVAVTTSNMCFTKRLYEQIGGFRSFRYVHDWDFALRASKKGGVAWVSTPITAYRLHQANTIREDPLAVVREVSQVFDDIDNEGDTNAQQSHVREGRANNRFLREASMVTKNHKLDISSTILVTGMHRSGTSATARCLNEMGLFGGCEDDFLPPNEWNRAGYFEHKTLVQLNNQILSDQGCAWDDLLTFYPKQIDPAFIRHIQIRFRQVCRSLQDQSSNKPVFLKDPRLCATLPCLMPKNESARVVFVYRDPLRVANSLKTRDRMGYAMSLALWELYSFKMAQNAKHHDVFTVNFDQLLKQPEETINALATWLGVSVDAGKVAASAIKQELADASEIESMQTFSRAEHRYILDALQQGNWQAIVKANVSQYARDQLNEYRKLVIARRNAAPMNTIRDQLQQLRVSQADLLGDLDRRLAAVEESLVGYDPKRSRKARKGTND